ncbi:AraC family transcriptional regulator [Paenibacillus spongiae]|uniref:AraC family transcriptional regulator n=1 Tax=Paenibacillus spongiae TaxID=2909671 RepID=A0ABY5S601_9BACL|nr:AraC family transcriptional regulator [Paenibacillus spongiae]UVI28255.1 AraC family transcriptional regulator [Paenibacillus spongiae]
MMDLDQMHLMAPSIRVAHHYRFPLEWNPSQTKRIGYCYALHLVDEGKGSITASGRTYPLKKGDLAFVPPRLLHSFHSNPDHPMGTYNIYCELWSDAPMPTPHHLVWDEADFDKRLLTAQRHGTPLDRLPLIISLQHRSSMMELFTHAVNQHQLKALYSTQIAGCLLKGLLLELVQAGSDSLVPDYRMTMIMERIDKEATAGSRYDEWLAGSGLRKTQFHERFKQATGLSPKAYWTKAIMKQAAAALRESNRSVTGIAEDLGYSSIHHFSKQFTSYFGVSPTEFRKRQR